MKRRGSSRHEQTPQDTQDLINGVSALGVESAARPQWESTTSYLNADLKSLTRRTATIHDVSDRTVHIDDELNPLTPLRRTVSGSSLDFPTGDDASVSIRPQGGTPAKAVKKIDFDLLQQLLQTLPLSQRNVHFKGILAHYLRVLRDHGIDAASDKFIITIYNQLRGSNVRSKLERVIDVFIDEPSNEAMRLSHYLHFQEFKTQEKLFQLWIIKRRKLTELNKNEEIWKIYAQKKFLSRWIFKHRVVTEDFEDNADIFGKVKLMMKFWDIWRANFEECEEMDHVSRLQVKAKVFHKWAKRSLEPPEAESFHNGNLLKRTLKAWRLKTRTPNTVQPKMFHKWQCKLKAQRHMEECALELEMALHGGFFFSKWRKRSSKSLIKNEELNAIYKGIMAKKYADHWRQATELCNVEHEVIERRGYFLKQFVMNQFKQRFENEQKAMLYGNGRCGKLQSNVLKRWRNKIVLRQTQRSIQSNAFQLWRKKHHLNNLTNDYELIVQQKFLKVWLTKNMEQMKALELSKSALESYTKVIYLNNWKSSVDNARKDQVIADGYFIGKFLQALQSKKEKIKMMNQEALRFRTEDPYHVVKQCFFNKLVDKWDTVKENKLAQHVPKVRDQMQQSLVRSILQLWKNQHQTLLAQEALFKEEFVRERLLRPLLRHWESRHRGVVEMEQKANAINDLNLVSTGFTKMQLALYKVHELEEQLAEYMEDASLTLVQKYLNRWSVQLMKAKRDNETVSQFQKRWNRAHLRGLLQLWFVKSQQASTTYVFDSSFDDQDSPTRGKSRMQSTPLRLRTPQKFVLESLETTASMSISRGSIPGSERIKRKRMEALKSHYSQVKHAIPSPIKGEPGRPPFGVASE